MAPRRTTQVSPASRRISLDETDQAKSVVTHQLVDRQTRHIRLRLQSLERDRSVLPSKQRWPTRKATEAYYKKSFLELMGPSQELSTTTEIQFRERLKLVEDLRRRLNPDPRDFPFALDRPAALKTFTNFCLLPTEIRLQIWETAFHLPRFIEAQFITGFHQELFVNCPSAHVLLGVCRESREIALYLKAKVRRGSREERLTGRRVPDYRRFELKLSLPEQRQEQLITPIIRTSRFLSFDPEKDTIYFRCLNKAMTGFSINHGHSSIPNMISGVHEIQHLAIALKDRGLPSPNEWRGLLLAMRSLKTVTFLLGCEGKSWTGIKHTVLRDPEEWFVDGRDRLISSHDGDKIDIQDVGEYMAGWEYCRSRTRAYYGTTRASAEVMVRVVAWKRIGDA